MARSKALQKLDESALVATIDHKKWNSIGYEDGELSDDRQRLLNRYHGLDLGNEVEGRSKVKTREVFEAIEWLMPSLMRTFSSSEKVAQFDAKSLQDEPWADLATEYINHVFYKDNNGYHILHTWFKDALLQRNGTVRVYWEDEEEIKKETYEGLTPDQVQMFGLKEDGTVDKNIEITNATERSDGYYDITAEIKEKKGKIKIENVPPEELLVSKDLRTLDYRDRTCDFVLHRLRTTPSELISQGFDSDLVYDLHSGDDGDFFDEAVNRRLLEDENPDHNTDDIDPGMREIWLDDAYIRIDFDGDGISELRHVLKGGDKILINEVVDEIPYETITPIIMGHKWVGLSVADAVEDLQEQSTTLRRQMMDNLYNVNNGRVVANEDSVNLDDLLTPVPNGVVRCEGTPVNEIVPLQVPPVIHNVIPALDIIRNEFFTRTGVAPSISADANVLQQTTSGAFNQAAQDRQQRQEMIIRNFAEGVKRLLLHIHRLVLQNQDYTRSIKLKNQWVPVDPREWDERDNMSINVGIGMGAKDSQLQKVLQIIADQKEHMMNSSPLVSPINLFNSYEEAVKLSELKDVNRYYTNPQSPEGKQMAQNQSQQPDPQQELVQGQLQLEQQKLQLEGQKQQAANIAKKIELDIKQRELEIKEFEAQARVEIELAKLSQNGEEAKVEVERIKNEYKLQIEGMKEENKASIERMKAEYNRVTEIEKKAMEVESKIEEAKAKQSEESNKPKNKSMKGNIGDRDFNVDISES